MEETKDFLRPINTKSVVQRVVNRLTTAMINKELKVSDKVPTEIELSKSFGVGRNSIREAIKILVAFGVFEIRRPEGTFVTNEFSEKMLDPLLYGIILDESNSLESLKELREWIDWGILRLAVLKADEHDISELEKSFENLQTALQEKDIQKIFDADNAFHVALNNASHNSLFFKIADLIRILTSELRLRTIKKMSQLDKLNALEIAHKNLLDSVKKNPATLSREIIVDGYFYNYDVLSTTYNQKSDA